MENEKKGFFKHITGGKKEKSSSCCCNFEVEEIPSGSDNNKDCGCSSNSGDCCSIKSDTAKSDGASELVEKKSITIDFLFLDLSVCTRCQDTDTSLEEALAEVSKVLQATGIEVIVNKINVSSEELALKYKFISSPTIRANGRDIQMEFKENLCESCGDLCGDEVECRVWIYQGREYNAPPKSMIIEALLKEVYGGSVGVAFEGQDYVMPENLKHFYSVMGNKQ